MPLDCRPACRRDGIRPHRASVLQEGRNSANIHVGSGVIRGIPVKVMTRHIACALALLVTTVAWSPAMCAEEKIALCHAGLIKLASFAKHLKLLRGLKRYDPKDIDELIEQQRKARPEFFSSQVIVQEKYSGSGTYDLRMFHGLFEPQSYRNVTAWGCEADEDFPIVYFVGFRVRKIENGTIFVSREKDIVNVISLNALDRGLDKHIKVQLFEGAKVLCPDIATGCDQRIFYSRE